MFLRSFFILFILCLFESCDFFQEKFGQSSTTFDTIIDVHRVDAMPFFSACDSVLDVASKNRCFHTKLYQQVSKNLLSNTFKVSKSIDETVYVKIRFDNEGKASLEAIEQTDLVKEQIPQLDSLVLLSVQTMPKVYPALKKGIEVASVHIIPIGIHIN